MSKKSFISGALILMLSGLVVRIMGFVYRIYLSNLIGAEGMGLFQLIFPLYSLVILTLTAGISISVSKMVAEELAKNHYANLRRIMVCGLQIVMGASVVVSLFCYVYVDFIANSILKDWRTYFSLVLLIPCIPIIAAASALKGYFYGIQEMVPTAISQIVEQAVKIGLVMLTAGWFLNVGLEYACGIAAFGIAAGEMANLAVLYLAYCIRKKKADRNLTKNGLLRKRVIYKDIIWSAIPISFNRFVISSLGAIETILIPARLMAGGMNHEQGIAEFGKLAGMAMPLIFFPTVITSALATALVPAISEAMSIKNFKTANYRISKSMQMAFALGIAFTVIFVCYPNQIGDAIYKKDKVGSMLYLLSFTCIFLYLQQILIGILNGLGKQMASLCSSLTGSVIRIGFVYFCVPLAGVKGYVWGIIMSSVIVCVWNICIIKKETSLQMNFQNWILKPIVVGVIMVACSKYIYSFFTVFHAGGVLTIFLTLTVNIAMMVELMVIVGVIDKGEILRILGVKRRS
jgi:stage V sporulation protein B